MPGFQNAILKIEPASYYAKEKVGAHLCQLDIDKSCAVSIASCSTLTLLHLRHKFSHSTPPLTRRFITTTRSSEKNVIFIPIISCDLQTYLTSYFKLDYSNGSAFVPSKKLITSALLYRSWNVILNALFHKINTSRIH